ncbi:hypothetical protein ERJ75_000610000 [Trypanosoma vivax]|nr:hypothetical protein ERJ75_000610000 [Trypanosoma vivax]
MRHRAARTAPGALAVPNNALLTSDSDFPRTNLSLPASPPLAPKRDAWRARARSVAVTGAGRARKAHSAAPGQAASCATQTASLPADGRSSGPGEGTPRRTARLRVNSRDARFAAGVKERDRGPPPTKKGDGRREGTSREGRVAARRGKDRNEEGASCGWETRQRTKKARHARRPGREKHAHEQSDARQPGPAERTPKRGAQYARPGEEPTGARPRWRRSSTAEAWTQRERCLEDVVAQTIRRRA